MLENVEITLKWRSIIFAGFSSMSKIFVWRDVWQTPWIFQNRRNSAELRKSPALKIDDQSLEKVDFVASKDTKNFGKFVEIVGDLQAVGEDLFFFYRESENKRKWKSRIGSVRINETGSDQILQNDVKTWESFKSVSIKCPISKTGLVFSVLSDMKIFEIKNETFFMGIFITRKNELPGSAICVFRLNEILWNFSTKGSASFVATVGNQGAIWTRTIFRFFFYHFSKIYFFDTFLIPRGTSRILLRKSRIFTFFYMAFFSSNYI